MTWELLAQLPSSEEMSRNVGLVVLKVLAVAGGALLGGLGAGFGSQGLAKMLYGGKLPKQVQTIFQIAGGVVAAWLVAFLVFWGMGGGGGGGTGTGGGEGAGVGTGKEGGGRPTNPSTGQATGSSSGSNDTGSHGGVPPLKVKVLPGGGVDDPIYQVEGEDKARNLESMVKEMKSRKEATPGLDTLEIQLVAGVSPAPFLGKKTPVEALEDRARELKLTPSTKILKPDKKDNK